MVFVFLILAAQYEKWSLPVAVLLGVPFAMFGALVAVWLRGMSNDIYFQIGLVTLVGLAAKNAILIVEFASQRREAGDGVVEAATNAARLRFRPIVMTSLAFILGVLPLALATGAGAAARRSMGTGVLGGMLFATLVGVLFIPLFFRWVSRDGADANRHACPATKGARHDAPSRSRPEPPAQAGSSPASRPLSLGLTGCLTMGPDYERPELPVPEAYSQPADTTEAQPAPVDDWWKLFGDPVLDALVEEALAANQDLAAAVARVDEARALAGIARAERLPQLSGAASGSRDKFSERTAQFPPGVPLELDTYRATAHLSFELDFWGRLARLSEAARAELLASEEGRRNVRLAVVSETVLAYFDLLALEHQLAIADETLSLAQRIGAPAARALRRGIDLRARSGAGRRRARRHGGRRPGAAALPSPDREPPRRAARPDRRRDRPREHRHGPYAGDAAPPRGAGRAALGAPRPPTRRRRSRAAPGGRQRANRRRASRFSSRRSRSPATPARRATSSRTSSPRAPASGGSPPASCSRSSRAAGSAAASRSRRRVSARSSPRT